MKKSSIALAIATAFWIVPLDAVQKKRKKVIFKPFFVQSAAPEAKPIQFHKADLENTPFGKWLRYHKSYLKKKDAYLSNDDDLNSKKLTTAGLLYLLSLPLEIQQEIMQYLVDQLSPTTLGVQREDLSYGSEFNHTNTPYLSHNAAKCHIPWQSCKPQPIILEYGYFKNSTVANIPQKIDYLWRLIGAISQKENLPDPVLLVVNPKELTLFTGHKLKSSGLAPTYKWTIAKLSKNKKILREPKKHSFDLTYILALLDAENSLNGKRRYFQLTKRSIATFNALKEKMAQDFNTQDGLPPVEPLLADSQFSNTFYPRYNQLPQQESEQN